MFLPDLEHWGVIQSGFRMKGADAGNVAQSVPAVGPAGVPPGVCKEAWRDSRGATGEQTALRAGCPQAPQPGRAVPLSGAGCATFRARLILDPLSITPGTLPRSRGAVPSKDLMEKRGRKVATHAAGAGGALMQNIHCAFACPNTVICEILPALGGIHLVIARDFHFENGDVLPPEQPGIGITLTDENKNRYPFVAGSGEFNSVPGKVLVD